jgi:hypothetical protein
MGSDAAKEEHTHHHAQQHELVAPIMASADYLP